LNIEPGARLLHYEIVDKLGEGGMGVVWRARDTTLDRDVAIKVLPDLFAGDEDRLARFRRAALPDRPHSSSRSHDRPDAGPGLVRKSQALAGLR
jgi:serine/threonine protein kinase